MTLHSLSALAEMVEERRQVRERLSRCHDLFGQMLLTGKLKRLDREIAALRARSAMGDNPNG